MAIKSFLSEGGFSVGSVGSTPIEVIDPSGNVTAVGLTVSGNLVVNGSTTTINSTTTTLDDPIFTLGGDTAPTSDDNKDRGIEFRWHTGSLAKVGFFGYDDSTGKFVFIPDATNSSEVFSGTKGTLDANIEWADVLNKPDPVVTVTLTGDVTGTANATLTDLGNGTITVATTIAADSIALGTDTTGNYVASITNGSYITGGNGGSEGAALTLAVDATSANTASKVVARDASGNFSAGVITGTRLEARNSGTTQIYLDSTTSGSKEIVFQNNGATAGYVWASGSYVGLGGGSAATSLFVTAASGNTGIGTTSPGGRLEVNFPVASGATALILRTSDGGANGTIRWQNSAAANGAAIGSNYNVSDVGALEFLNGNTTNVIFRSSGNVGIGTTAPGQKLEVNGNILAGNSVANNSISVTRTGANSSSLSLQAFTDSPAITWDGAGGYLRFIYSSTEQMRITSGGNVGIGVTSPGAKLHVAGAHADEGADRAATTAFIVDTKTNGTGDGKTYIKTGWVNTGNYGVSTLAVGYYASGTQVRDVITMLGTGNVGIGVSAPVVPLEVKDAGAGNKVAHFGSGYVRIGGSIDNGSSTVLNVAPGVVAFDAPGVVGGRFTINSSGNVGIGNTSPSNKLDVTGAIRTTDWYYVDGSGFGMYNNATGLYLSTIGNNWDISSASGQTWSGLRLYSGGKNVTWRGHFYGDGTGQGFLDSAGNWALRVDSSKRLIAYSGIANMDAGIRVSMPGGAAYATTTSTITGAFKIKLPTARYKSDSMLRMTINIYQYSTGQSLKFNVGGYNYNHATNAWLNVFAEQESDSNATVYTVRFGDDGTSNCIWIGETNSTWSYPQVFVSDFQAGFGGTTADWASSWAITAVTAFDTVYTSRVSAIKVTSNNIGTYGVSSITGTANQITASASTGAVTLSLPQNIHTGATPTFSSLTLSGDVITLSGSGVSAYANSTARIYNQTGVGPTINGNSLEVRTGSSGTLALTVNSSQHSLFAGRASTGVFPGFTSAQLPQYGMGVAYGTDATSYAATGSTRAPDGYTIAIGPFNNTNRYSQIVFGVGNGGVNGFSYIGGAAHGTSYLAHLIFGRTTGAASYAESMRIDGSSGNVLIGAVADGGQKLQVNGTGYFAGNLTVGTGSAAVASVLNRGTTAQSSLAQWQTASAANWSVGSGATGTNTNLEFYNHNTASSNLTLNYTTGAATFAGAVNIPSNARLDIGTYGGRTGFIQDTPTTDALELWIKGTKSVLFATSQLTLLGAAGNARSLLFATGTSTSSIRWVTQASGTAESGSNAGSDYRILSYNDAGTFLATPLAIERATSNATFAGAVTAAGNLTVSGTGTSAINNLSITPTSGHVYLTGPSAAGKFITLQNGNATGGINFRDSAGNEVGSYYQVTDAWVFSKNTTVSGNLTVSQNLIVNGTTTTVNSTVSTIKDPIVTLGGGDAGTAAASDDNKDRGIEFKWHNGTAAKTGFFGFDDSTGYFTFIPDATNTSEVFSGTQGDIQASNFRGNLIGNVTGNVSGSAGSVATLTAGSYLTGTSFNGSTAVTFAVDATSANTASKVVARDASGNFSAGTITATLAGLATSETLSTVTGRGASTGSQISVSTGNGGSMFTGTKVGSGYSDQVSGATFKSITDNPNGGSYAFAAYYGGSGGTNSFYVGAGGDGYFKSTVSVNTTAPIVKLTTRSGTNALPATTGTAQAGAGLRVEGGDNAVIDIGTNSTDTWIQATDKTALNNFYKISINPRGGNVGIGTTSPSAKLDISGNSVQDVGLVRFVNDSTSGTFVPTASFIQTRGNHSFGVVAEFRVNTAGDTDRPTILFRSAQAAHQWRVGQVTSGWGTNDNFGIGYVASNASPVAWPTNYFTITTGGNVGIGVTGPSYKLEVNGSFLSGGLTNLGGQIYVSAVNNNTLNSGYGVNGVADIWINYRGYNDGQTQFRNFNIGDGKGANILWADGTNKRICINNGQTASYTLDVNGDLRSVNGAYFATSSGNVGIGTTSPGAKFHVAGNAIINDLQINTAVGGGPASTFTFQSNTAAGVNDAFIFNSSRNGGSYGNFEIQKTGTAKVHIGLGSLDPNTYFNIDGNFGIGVTSPAYKLDVAGTANAIAAKIGAASQYLTIGSYTPNSAGVTLGYNTTQYLGLNAFFGVLVGRTYVSNNTTAPADGMIIQGNVGIGTTSPGYKLEVNGSFAATTKSFVIKHPTKEGKKLRYGSLEGPENGVYVRGKLKGSNTIELPDYWTKLVDPESITVQLTPIGSHQKLYVEKIEDNKVYIANENLLSKAISCFFYVLAERIDVEKLQVEIDA